MMNTAFTVEELADYIEINSEELLKMLREERDDVNWTVDTVVQGDIADKFVEDYEKRRQKRQVKLTTRPTVGIELTPEYFANQQKDVKLALRQTISDLSINEILVEGIQSGFEEIAAYEKGRTDVWLNYARMVSQETNQQRLNSEQQRQSWSDSLANDNQQLLAELQELRDEASNMVNNSKKYYQRVVGGSGN